MKLHIRKSGIKKKHQGFRSRMKTKSGRRIVNGRRRQGKKRMTSWN